MKNISILGSTGSIGVNALNVIDNLPDKFNVKALTAYKNSNASVLIPVVNKNTITPHAEAFQALIWHLIVTHPKLSPKKNRLPTY